MAPMSESLTCDHPKEILLFAAVCAKDLKKTEANGSPSTELPVWPLSEKSCYPHQRHARDRQKAGSIGPNNNRLSLLNLQEPTILPQLVSIHQLLQTAD